MPAISPAAIPLASPQAGARMSHGHLKDVDAGLAARLGGGELSRAQAVRSDSTSRGEQGNLHIRAVIHSLQDADYEGWYVLERQPNPPP